MGSFHDYRIRFANAMAGWSMVADEDTVDHCTKSKKLDPHSKKVVIEGEAEDMALLFRHLLETFLKEFCSIGIFRPLPPMTGEGTTVDLFKLFLNVSDKGGFKAVSENGLWRNVAQDSGLGLNHSASAKLMYFKYLDVFGRWLNRVVAVEADCNSLELSGISEKLEAELKGFLSKIKKRYHLGKGSVESGTWLQRLITEMKRKYDEFDADDKDKTAKKTERADINETIMLLDSDEEKISSSCSGKRKRECSSEMLKWLSKVARDPRDPAIGLLPEKSKWASYAKEEPWKQILLFRSAVRSHNDSPYGTYWEKHLKMHPSMYDDSNGSGYHLRERLCVSGSSINEKKAPKAEKFSGKDPDEEEDPGVPIGSDYQAEVPEWTAMASESNIKWLGTKVWPLDKERNPRLLIERDPIGKGRQDSCGCEKQGSLECVRFHVNEKRAKLKLELGSAFFRWGFDEMGETITQLWTASAQKKMKDVIKTPPLLNETLLDHVGKSLPVKNRAEVVRYYYNVTLLQDRARQNRNVPCVIDSDPDEAICDSISTHSPTRYPTKSPKPILLSPKKPNR